MTDNYEIVKTELIDELEPFFKDVDDFNVFDISRVQDAYDALEPQIDDNQLESEVFEHLSDKHNVFVDYSSTDMGSFLVFNGDKYDYDDNGELSLVCEACKDLCGWSEGKPICIYCASSIIPT